MEDGVSCVWEKASCPLQWRVQIEAPVYQGRRHGQQGHYVTAEFLCETVSTIDQNFTLASPGRARVWNRQWPSVKIICLSRVILSQDFITIKVNSFYLKTPMYYLLLNHHRLCTGRLSLAMDIFFGPYFHFFLKLELETKAMIDTFSVGSWP